MSIISVLLLLALVSDLRTYKVKNSITYSFMIVGLTANLVREGLEGLMFSLQGIILPAACLMILYVMRVVGAGDIKLLSAVGAVMGAGFVLYATVCSFICGGFIASGIILARHNGAGRFKYLIQYVKSCFLTLQLLQYTDFKDIRESGRFHFSIAIASGTVAVIIVRGFGLAGL
ncbi:MAG: A24 family peptidase [Clostridiaceae bacterium]|nr:A24 family peptidase [Clostridiaceae bacterium]